MLGKRVEEAGAGKAVSAFQHAARHLIGHGAAKAVDQPGQLAFPRRIFLATPAGVDNRISSRRAASPR
jgi:hypothetical protein